MELSPAPVLMRTRPSRSQRTAHSGTYRMPSSRHTVRVCPLGMSRAASLSSKRTFAGSSRKRSWLIDSLKAAVTDNHTREVSSSLAGMHVVSLALNVPGPVAARHLLMLGARVTKVEPPTGDPLSLLAPDWYLTLHHDQNVRRLDLRRPDDVAELH